jgi:uncharacterized protein (TIGR01619 family)
MSDEIYEEDWAIYFTTIQENQIGAILVDIGLVSIAPVETKPFLLTFATLMNHPDENGLSSASENQTLNQIEDGLIESLVSKHQAIYAGRLKAAGRIQSYFYCEKTDEIEDTISEAKFNYPTYNFQHKFSEERDWETYFEILYPEPIEMQSIQNGRVIENLQEHGDSLEKERLVEHWIYFKSETDRESFLDAIKDKGFEVVGKDETDSRDDSPFALRLSRLDKVDYKSVDKYVLYLWQTAQEFGGDYDGWETFVVKD